MLTTAEMLREAIDLSQKASDETRTLSYLLYPPTLDHAGLRSALEWYIDGFTQRSKVKVELDVSIGRERLAEIVERTLFRDRTGEPYEYIPPLGKRYRERSNQPAVGNCSFGSGGQWQRNPG